MVSERRTSFFLIPPTVFRDSLWWMTLIVITVLSFGTRLYKVHEPDHVWYVHRANALTCKRTSADSTYLFGNSTVLSKASVWLCRVPCVVSCSNRFFQLGRNAFRKDGQLVHKQNVLFRRTPTVGQSKCIFCFEISFAFGWLWLLLLLFFSLESDVDCSVRSFNRIQWYFSVWKTRRQIRDSRLRRDERGLWEIFTSKLQVSLKLNADFSLLVLFDPRRNVDNIHFRFYLGNDTFIKCCYFVIGFSFIWYVCLWFEIYQSLHFCCFTDVGTLTLTQYILLDPILLFFMLASFFGICKFRSTPRWVIRYFFLSHYYFLCLWNQQWVQC